MGGNDYCAVYGCSNSRKDKSKNVVKSHVGVLRWHTPRNMKDMKLWEKRLNRGGKFKISMSTKVCSNHFTAGYCSDICSLPTLYLKGYDEASTPDRKSPRKRTNDEPFTPKPKKTRHLTRNGFDDNLEDVILTPMEMDHQYEFKNKTFSARTKPIESCGRCNKVQARNILLEKQILDLKEKLYIANKESENRSYKFSIDEIKNDSSLVIFYTGLQNYEVFLWLINRLKSKSKNIQYYRGSESFTPKRHQLNDHKKSGKKRQLSFADEVFLVLIRLRLNLAEKDLAHRFKVSQSCVSQILATFIPFLAKELTCLIYWPTQEEVYNYYPKCFSAYKNVIGIIDCTEGAIEKPSLAKAQSQTYSSYKSKNTWKKLISITPAGTISFISKCYGGSASDRYVTETSGLLDKINYGDNLMADKGFNISDLLVYKGSKLIIPPFVKDKCRFTKRKVQNTSNIAKARIHVERAIARIKDFRILQGVLPITLKDQIDDIFVICSAITNLGPALVPL